MRIAVAADHAGFPLKEPVLEWVRLAGHEAVDFGTGTREPVDYPDVIAPAARAVAMGECDLAIVLGGSGTGEAIVANKIRGIRCVEAADPVTARLGREHNDANVLAMGERIVGHAVARACVEAFLTATFEGGRHAVRVAKIASLEASAQTTAGRLPRTPRRDDRCPPSGRTPATRT
jgi:ribose 5-phosphate isomerase B